MKMPGLPNPVVPDNPKQENHLAPKPAAPVSSGKAAAATETSKDGEVKNATPYVQRITTVFHLAAPWVKSVKLAADFTDWEAHALNLHRGRYDIWEVKVSLPPGRYYYRFLVDGEWRDDPCCERREPNPFGTSNSIIEVN